MDSQRNNDCFKQTDALNPRIRKMTEDLFRPIEDGSDLSANHRRPMRCDVAHCGLPAICFLERRLFCLNHFISHCYRRLGQCGSTPYADPDPGTSELNDLFLQKCAEQASNLVHPIRGLDNLDRARLFDIFLWASELTAKRNTFKTETSSPLRRAAQQTD
jgi:hypothetical protein